MSAVAEQPAAEAEAALLSYLGSVLGEDAPEDLSGPALRTALTRVEKSIAAAEAEVVQVVEEESALVARVLGGAERLREELAGLTAHVSSIDCDALREKLEATVLRVPTLRKQLETAQTEEMLLGLLGDAHRAFGRFETAMGLNDLGGAADEWCALRTTTETLRAHPVTKDAPLLEAISRELDRCRSRLCQSAREAWASAALGTEEGGAVGV